MSDADSLGLYHSDSLPVVGSISLDKLGLGVIVVALPVGLIVQY